MRVDRLMIEDFRGIEHLDLTLPKGSLLVLLGENGAGKSSVLAAIAYGLLAPILPSSGFRSAWNVRASAGEAGQARVQLDTTAGTTEASITRRHTLEVVEGRYGFDAESIWDDNASTLFLAGYGATRRVEAGESFDPELRNRSTGRRLQRVGSLFEPGFTLVPIETWLRPPHPRHAEVARIIDRATPGDLTLSKQRGPDGQLLFHFRGQLLPLRALSDGYRAHVGWLADLLFHLDVVSSPSEPLTTLPGVVLLDEIDLHLHPSWQRQVLQTLQETLPALQFIVTTHSPLVLGGVESAAVRVFRQVDGRLTVEQPGIETYGMSPDQLLLSDLFGLESTRAPAFVERLKEVEKAASNDPKSAIRYQQMLTRGAAGDVEPDATPAPDWLEQARRAPMDLELE